MVKIHGEIQALILRRAAKPGQAFYLQDVLIKTEVYWLSI
jgi:hypothetical protein